VHQKLIRVWILHLLKCIVIFHEYTHCN
jgi:hypothetical protein